MAFQQPRSFLLCVLILAVTYCGTYELQSPMTKLIQNSLQNKQQFNSDNSHSNIPRSLEIQNSNTGTFRLGAVIKDEDDITHYAKQYSINKGAVPPVFMGDMTKGQQKLSKRHQVPCSASIPVTFSEDEPLPWTCRQRKQWVSIDNYYPSRLQQTVCESSTCMNGHYNCTPVTYSVPMLRMCAGSRCDDQRMPPNLRQIWRFVNLDVTVGCTCTR